MEPITGGLLAGGIGGLFNFFGQQQTNQNQMQMLQQGEAYQTQMSNTAYQRASADMKAAGLNPMIMAGSGGPASTPSAPNFGVPKSPMGGVGDSISKALDMAVTAKTADRMSEEIAKMRTEMIKIAADTEVSRAQTRAPGVPGGANVGSPIALHSDVDRVIAQTAREKMPAATAEGDIGRLTSKAAADAPWLVEGGKMGNWATDMLSPGFRAMESLGIAKILGLGGSSAKSTTADVPKGPTALQTKNKQIQAAKDEIVRAGGKPKASDVLERAKDPSFLERFHGE